MALQKSIKTDANISAAYHRISGILCHDTERTMEIHVQSFKDAATRAEVNDEGGPRFKPANTPVIRITGKEFDALFGDGTPDYPPKAALYGFLKSLPYFSGAADV